MYRTRCIPAILPRGAGRKGADAEGDIEQTRWHTACSSLEELQALVAKLAGSKHSKEKELHKLLAGSILPKLEETANARRRAEEKAALYEAMPKKRSSRWVVERSVVLGGGMAEGMC